MATPGGNAPLVVAEGDPLASIIDLCVDNDRWGARGGQAAPGTCALAAQGSIVPPFQPQIAREKRLAMPKDYVCRGGRIPATGCKI